MNAYDKTNYIKKLMRFTVWCYLIPLLTLLCIHGIRLAEAESVMTTSSGLQYVDLKQGLGREAHVGETAFVHYTGWLADGTKFDSSKDQGEPFAFRIGAGRVIKGWDEGVEGMHIGGIRKLTIPPHLGYGERGAGNVIPPNATLIFEVELLDLR